ncbi:MAG: transporter [Nitrospiraceae bacterium]|nr:MAG: transporter [Nitrospiraceae bacterium]
MTLFFLIFTVCFSLFTVSYAAHPLITDDTGTQGKGKSQIEINSEYASDKERQDNVSTEDAGIEVSVIYSYGFTDNADVVLGMPYLWSKTKEDGETVSDEDGIGDTSIELKWRLFEKEGLSFALKPGITLPTGDEEKGLGNGRPSYALMFIATQEMEVLSLHMNLGYLRNEYKLEEDKSSNRKDLWYASLAAEKEVSENLSAVANVGMERNSDKNSKTQPAFILGGLIYSVSEDLDIDIGIKAGLNKPETDLAVLAGLAARF